MLNWWLAAGFALLGTDLIVIDPTGDASPSQNETAIATEPEPTPMWTPPLVRIQLLSRVLLNPSLRDMRAEVLQMWHVGWIRAELGLGTHLQWVAEAQVRWGAYGKMPVDAPLLGVNVRDSQWVGEAALREAYLQWRWDGWGASVGQRLLAWGKNELGAPADGINPLDLRYDPTALFVAPRLARVPVFMLTGHYTWGHGARVEAVVQPFFVPNRIFLGGHDNAALVADPAGSQLFLLAMGSFGATARDLLQQAAVGTDIPGAAPSDSTVALRGSAHLADWDFALTGIYGWNRTPITRIDGTAQVLLQATPAQINAAPQLYLAALLGLAQSGNSLVTVTYQRLWQLALEGEGPVGPLMLRWDVGWAPDQLHLTRAFSAASGHSLRGVVSADYAAGERWLLAVASTVQAVYAPGRSAPLLALETSSSKLPPWAVGWSWLVSGRYTWPDAHLEARMAALYEVWPGDGIAWAQLGYSPWESHTFALGGSYLAGSPSTLGDIYRVNSYVYAQYQGAW